MSEIQANALISVDEYIELSGRSGDESVSEDAIIPHINTASKLIERYLNRVICPVTAISEKFSGSGSDQYYVNHRFIDTTTAPTIYYYDGTNWVEMTTTLYPRDVTGAKGLIELTQGYAFWEGKKNFKVDYNTGYATADVPADIKGCCFRIVQRLRKLAEKKEGLTSESFGDATTSYELNDITKNILKDLNSYRSVCFG